MAKGMTRNRGTFPSGHLREGGPNAITETRQRPTINKLSSKNSARSMEWAWFAKSSRRNGATTMAPMASPTHHVSQVF
jgi:hypothetical protein